MPAIGSMIKAPYIAGRAAIDHQTASSTGISNSHERPIPPSARDHENSGGLGLIPPTGYDLSESKIRWLRSAIT